MDILVVVDMQNDFIDGSLGTKEAQAIVDKVVAKIKGFKGPVLFTRDTHFENYSDTQEGRNLPVEHCIKGSFGHEIRKEIDTLRKTPAIDKITFGSTELCEKLLEIDKTSDKIESVTFVGLCTDICVISNAMCVKAFLPEVEIIVDSSCCAGTTPENHDNALKAMQMCQIKVV